MRKIIVVETRERISSLRGVVKNFAKERGIPVIQKSNRHIQFFDMLVVFFDIDNFNYGKVIKNHDSPETTYIVVNVEETKVFGKAENVIRVNRTNDFHEIVAQVFQLETNEFFRVNLYSNSLEVVTLHKYDKITSKDYKTELEAKTVLINRSEYQIGLNNKNIDNLKADNEKLQKLIKSLK